MKKNYISPMISVETIETVSVLCASGGLTSPKVYNFGGTAIEKGR